MITIQSLAKKHRELDFLIEKSKGKKPFLSDWNCKHPFYIDYFSKLAIKKNQTQTYNYVRSDKDLTQLISSFHSKYDEPNYSSDEILVSNGSTTIISAFFIWLKLQGIEYVYYVPPIYFTFHFLGKIHNISFRPITKNQLMEKSMDFNFPQKKSVLILTDPIWYAGYSIPREIIDKIAKWQKSTKSLVFIDGSFQYFKWDNSKLENSSSFDKNLTFRLVCPSKSIATHGLRFSYLLLPKKFYDEYDFILDNLNGSSNLYDIAFAKKCMKLLSSAKSNNELINYVKNKYGELIEKKIISTTINHDCGYFIFAKLNKKSKMFCAMDGTYFEQKKYKDYVRINLLGSGIQKLI